MTLVELVHALREAGASRAYFKTLAANDNSKNQIYLGPSLSVGNAIPGSGVPQAARTGVSGPIFRVPLDFHWLTLGGAWRHAPQAKLILYPQYPEVRLSGLLLRVPRADRPPLANRVAGRVLILGVTPENRILGHIATRGSLIAMELAAHARPSEEAGVLLRLPVFAPERPQDERSLIVADLARIARKGWIDSYRLKPDGSRVDCDSPQCGGYTLEAELGIRPNSKAEPDHRGWEVKQHSVASDGKRQSSAITLMTSEPDGGYYAEHGVIEFIHRFGYPDTAGRQNRMNFGGVHRVGRRTPKTGLTLRLRGFDSDTRKITDAFGALELVNDSGVVAAAWSFAKILQHWSRKHLRAAYVPSMRRSAPRRQYRYGPTVALGEGTRVELFLSALASGIAYYDPAPKVTREAGKAPVAKARNQIRILHQHLSQLYDCFTELSLD